MACGLRRQGQRRRHRAGAGLSEANAAAAACPLCRETGGGLVWQNALCRVVAVDDADYPGFCRVIVNRHCREMTDLPAADRQALMAVVWTVEAVLRETLQPDKINLASLGNVVPHLHWHVIPRWRDDRNFPDPIWCAPQREPSSPAVDASMLAEALRRSLAGRC